MEHELQQWIEKRFGSSVTRLQPLSGGRNNRAYCVETADGEQFIVKTYYDDNRRDRLQVEFSALRFLWEHGERAIPEPLDHDDAARLGAYTLIEGERPYTGEMTQTDLEAMASFLERLHAQRLHPDAAQFSSASDDGLCLEMMICSLERRRRRFDDLGPASIRNLLDDWGKASDAVLPSFRKGARSAGIDLQESLPKIRQTLSPSDFGLHNAIRRPDGTLNFLDFEYFGWDDPAKLICDTLMHPGMDLATADRKRFWQALWSIYAADERLAFRVRLCYPLHALKWCLICLNEFLPANNSSRSFSLGNENFVAGHQQVQLARARRFLAQAQADLPGWLTDE